MPKPQIQRILGYAYDFHSYQSRSDDGRWRAAGGRAWCNHYYSGGIQTQYRSTAPVDFIAVRLSEQSSSFAEDSTKKPNQKGVFPIQAGDIRYMKGENVSEDQTRAFKKAFLYIVQKDFYGGHKYIGNFFIAYSIEKARSLTFSEDGSSQWQALHKENAHIGIAVHDETDLNFVAGLVVIVTVTDEKGNSLGSFKHPLLRRPNFKHYGRNWILPGDGKYNLHVRVETPVSMLWNKSTGKSYLSPVEVEFQNVPILTGKASH